ncbi:MAG: LPS-assembly protein LptD [Alphaproteobacteria bacterium]|nr:LPS-assembly protein LptD [Alphaproteobacteria bacterium]
MRRLRFLTALLLVSALGAPAAAQLPGFVPQPRRAPPRVAPASNMPCQGTGQREIVYRADTLDYDSNESIITLTGHVEIDEAGCILLADRVTYDRDDDKVTASGHVSLTDEHGNVAFMDNVVLTDRLRNGVLNGFGALIGKNGRLAAVSAQRINGTVVIANRAVYSPCTICNQPGHRTPLWQVKSERIIYDSNVHKVRFKNASLEALGVPILWSPYLSLPDPTIRYATGFLTPDIGNSTKFGYFARLPFYLALSPSRDMTITPMISSLGGNALEGEYRQRQDNGGFWLQASAAYKSDGGLGGTGTGAQFYDHIFGSGRFALSGNWQSGFDLQLTNNSAYMRFYDISFLDRLNSNVFLENDSGRSRFNLAGYFFQGLRATDAASAIPVAAPFLEYSFIPARDVFGGQFRFDLNGIALSRGSGINQQRLSGELRWRLPLVAPGGQLWTFTADARGDGYRLEAPTATATLPKGENLVARGVPYVALDWRWPFLAQGGSGRSYILEPIAQLVAQPYGGNPKELRNEDSSDFEFSDTNLFSVNQLPGYDLVESGPRANVGLNAEALFNGGEVQAMVGQTYRLKPDPVLAGFAGQKGATSDVIGSFSVKFPHLSINDRIDVDRGNGSVNRHEVYITGSYNQSSLQVAYVQLPASATLGLPSREELTGQADLNVWDSWHLFAAGRRDLLSNQFIDTEYGLGYEDECLAISLAYRRRYTSDLVLGLPPSTAVILRLQFKTGTTQSQPFSLFPQDVFTALHR